MTQVSENGISSTTTYTYDALDNLTGVIQPGANNRTFSYSSMKRLMSALNPESGTISYTYDGNGNVATRAQAGGATISYTYNELDQLTGKTYSDSTPSASYTYNAGWRTSASSGSTLVESTLFDGLGRVKTLRQTTNGVAYNLQYNYNLADGVTSITMPSGRVVTTTYNTAGRPTAVQGSLSSQITNYVTSVGYAAHGGVSSMAMGNGITETRSYNARLQPASVQAGSLMSLQYTYNPTQNNGNLASQTITRGAQTWTQSYGYDGVNRLSSASESGAGSWSQSYGYDARGNRWVSGNSGLPPLMSETPQDASWYSSSNRIGSWGYDAAGNVTSIAGMSRTFIYDAENRQKAAVINGQTSTYSYDADGRRVQKVSPAETVVYLYGVDGTMAAEYSTAANPVNGTRYLTADMLGSTRLVTTGTGTVDKSFDYLPFGEELSSGTAGRGATFPSSGYPHSPTGHSLEFTGKERDAETGLDYFKARYLSSAQGRFTSDDPLNIPALQGYNPKQFASIIANPQNWNGYVYAHNNPLRKIDPDGFLTIIVPGTWNEHEDWEKHPFRAKVEKTFGEKAIVLSNDNMANTNKGRSAAAKQLQSIIANHKFADGEKLNIVAHSHGGNVVAQATQDGISHKIDTLVTLGTPIRSDYSFKESMIGQHLNVFSNNDRVQVYGGAPNPSAVTGLPRMWGRTEAERTLNLPGVRNLDATAVAGGHSELWEKPGTWDKIVVPALKK